MRKVSAIFLAVIFMAGIALADTAPTEQPAKVVNLKWQHLADKDGKTCDRCGATEVSLKQAMEVLGQHGVKVNLEETKMTAEDFAKNCSESNRIWLNDKPIEEVLGAEVGSSKCSGECAIHKADAQCRTLVMDGKTYEAIPAELIVKAGLVSAGMESDVTVKEASSKTLGCSKSCVKTCGKEAAAACTGKK
jgi:hypothetical protein